MRARPWHAWLAWLASLAIGCEPELRLEPAEVELPPMQAAPPAALEPAPEPVAPAELAPAPPPDPEALARAREEAERLRFERDNPWHGIAYHFLAQVYRRPDASSAVVGDVRRGARVRAQEGLRGSGCARGWHRVVGGGFVCRGAGLQMGSEPQSFEPSPVQPALDDALPYAYGRIARRDVPQYWRLPTRDEEAAAAPSAVQAEAAQPEAAPPAAAQPEPEPDLAAPPGLQAEAVEPPDAGAPAAEDPQPSYLRMRMQSGYYVSVDRLETADNRRFYRTIRGAYVPADAVAEVVPPAMRGVVLGGRWSLPLGFVYRGGARRLLRDPVRGTLGAAGEVDRLTPLVLRDEVIERQGRRFRVASNGTIVSEDALRIARPISRPPGVPEGAKWIHVDLASQVLVAYEGDRPVFATMVSTGREGYATPAGTFRIQSKHVSTTMDDTAAGDESYSIEDVPWTMYFEGSYALHAAFWHDRFGHRRSHGCVNLAPVDARWIFGWATPALPPGWHGVFTERPRDATVVHVTAP